MEYNNKYFQVIESKISPNRIFDYDFLNILHENIPFNSIYEYILSQINYKLKNIWNHIILKWIKSKEKLKKNKSYLKSIYYNQNYQFCHQIIDDDKLNQLLNEFIQEDIFKAVFVLECILNYS
jgi:hypothetical protein